MIATIAAGNRDQDPRQQLGALTAALTTRRPSRRRHHRPPKRRWRAANSARRLLERLAGEVRPQLVAKHQLGVGALPEQVVRDALLAARADDQVRVVHVGGVQVGAKFVIGVSGKGSSGVDDLRPAAVVERDEQRDPRVAAGQLLGPRHPLDQLLRDRRLPASDEAHADALVVQLGRLLVDPPGEHGHQRGDLVGRPVPVLGRERVDGQFLDPEVDRVAQARLDGVGPGLVAGYHREALSPGPAPVAVGDDRHVARAGAARLVEGQARPRGSLLPCASAARRAP